VRQNRYVGATLGLAIGALVAAHYVALAVSSGLGVDTEGVLAPLDLFQERSVGTWVNAALLAAVALAAAALSSTALSRARRGWAAVAGLLTLASVDEVAGFHESLVDAVRATTELPSFLYYAAWVVPALAVLAAFLAWQWQFLLQLPRWLAIRFATAAGIYVAAATGFEVIESEIFASRGGRDWSGVLQVLVGIEEGLEMSAAAVMLLVLLRRLAEQAPSWRVNVARVGPADARREHVSVSPVEASTPIATPESERGTR
jgi:hypothetical protein